jgi:Replication protein
MPYDENTVSGIIRGRMEARRARERAQMALLHENDTFHETIRVKLDGLLETKQFVNFSRCGLEDFYRTCRGCGQVEKMKAQCNLKWCPRCQWRKVEERKKVLFLWSARIKQPKHLVTTERNWEVMTRSGLRGFQKRIAKFKRWLARRGCRGGCVSIEVTHEGRGWHVHAHWLLDMDWLSMGEVSMEWGRLAGQRYAVVKVKDVRNESYLKEVTKYVCDGAMMAKWSAEHLLEFVTAIRGRRFFFAFGSLFKQSPAVRAALRANKKPGAICQCGCEDFVFETETMALVKDLRDDVKRLRGQPVGRRPARRRRRDDTENKEVQADLLPSGPNTSGSGRGWVGHDERNHLGRGRETRGKR